MRTHDEIIKELDKLFDGERGYWSEHPTYPLADWRYEVANDDTRQGYGDWLYNRLDQEEDTP